MFQDGKQERFLIDDQVVFHRELQGDDLTESPGHAREDGQAPRRGAGLRLHGLTDHRNVGVEILACLGRGQRLASRLSLVLQVTVHVAVETVLDPHVGISTDHVIALIRGIEQDFDFLARHGHHDWVCLLSGSLKWPGTVAAGSARVSGPSSTRHGPCADFGT